MHTEKIVGWSPHRRWSNHTQQGVVLGSDRPIPLVRMKGWLFMQGWKTARPDTQLHPLRWTSISKGQVWCAPPKKRGAEACIARKMSSTLTVV